MIEFLDDARRTFQSLPESHRQEILSDVQSFSANRPIGLARKAAVRLVCGYDVVVVLVPNRKYTLILSVHRHAGR